MPRWYIAYREGPTRARRTALERFATAHPKDQSGAAAHLALGAVAFDQKDYPSAVFHMNAAQARLPKLPDYPAYYAASAHAQAKGVSANAGIVCVVETSAVPSPLAPRAVLLEAKALVETGASAEAVRRLRERYVELPQPEADLGLATAYRQSGPAQCRALLPARLLSLSGFRCRLERRQRLGGSARIHGPGLPTGDLGPDDGTRRSLDRGAGIRAGALGI